MHPLPEYPRPSMRRDSYVNLNGPWDYAITQSSEFPAKWDGAILVPYSPEAKASGVGRTLQPGQWLHYHRTFTPPAGEGGRVLLHFGAVDYACAVEVNGRLAGGHRGGYWPFALDITDLLRPQGRNTLWVAVQDPTGTGTQARGKQTLRPGGMFYPAQSGIWQSVWYEWVPENYVINYKITPQYDKASVTFVLCSLKPFNHLEFRVNIPSCDGTLAQENTGSLTRMRVRKISEQQDSFGLTHTTVVLSFPASVTYSATDPADAPEPVNFKPWSPEYPWLYPFTLDADSDTVEGYFAMRCYSVEPDSKGIPRFCLNHRPYFLHGILDQGYWSDGLMTAPCDEAFVYDISLAKGLGFNMLRKHIKLESLRWYYHCDRLGMIVWQDMVSGGSTYHMPWVCYMPTLFPHMSAHTKDNHYELFSRGSEEGRKSWEQECLDTIDHLYNVPSIAVWVPFNEGWGQFDAARIAKMVAKKDPTRPVDHASGWFDQKGGDFRSIHNYFRPLQVKLDGKRAFVISEYGGYACHIDGHSSVDRVYGYQKYGTPEEMAAALKQLFSRQLFPLISKGLSGAVYTQLSDVEEEVNGLVTYDRRIVKLPVGHPFAAPSSFAAPYSHGNKPE